MEEAMDILMLHALQRLGRLEWTVACCELERAISEIKKGGLKSLELVREWVQALPSPDHLSQDSSASQTQRQNEDMFEEEWAKENAYGHPEMFGGSGSHSFRYHLERTLRTNRPHGGNTGFQKANNFAPLSQNDLDQLLDKANAVLQKARKTSEHDSEDDGDSDGDGSDSESGDGADYGPRDLELDDDSEDEGEEQGDENVYKHAN